MGLVKNGCPNIQLSKRRSICSKSITFLYISNKQLGIKIFFKVPFTMTLKNEILRTINITKYLQNLYANDDKTLTREIKEELSRQIYYVCVLKA